MSRLLCSVISYERGEQDKFLRWLNISTVRTYANVAIASSVAATTTLKLPPFNAPPLQHLWCFSCKAALDATA
ncbi:hypothetical protein PXNS11_350154 [Stutzerimonas xanthomarina]|nr:hypothetical protein PXNS11_350154 [Stutzerimonas xanthomarina]